MTIKCVVTDFDGTLLNDGKEITERDLAALRVLKEKNICIVIATGRSFESFFKALNDMGQEDRAAEPLPIDFVVFSTGAGILSYPSRRIIYKKSIPASGIRRITAYFDQHRIDYMVHRQIPETAHLLYKSHGSENPDFDHRLSLYNTHAIPLSRFENQFEHATEVLAVLPVHDGAKTVAAMREKLGEFSVIPATSPLDHQSLWIEVFHKSVSKSRTTEWLCRRLNLEKTDVLAIGNDYNDKDLLRWAGMGVVVENAPENLKKKFMTVRSNNDAGFENAVAIAGLLD